MVFHFRGQHYTGVLAIILALVALPSAAGESPGASPDKDLGWLWLILLWLKDNPMWAPPILVAVLLASRGYVWLSTLPICKRLNALLARKSERWNRKVAFVCGFLSMAYYVGMYATIKQREPAFLPNTISILSVQDTSAVELNRGIREAFLGRLTSELRNIVDYRLLRVPGADDLTVTDLTELGKRLKATFVLRIARAVGGIELTLIAVRSDELKGPFYLGRVADSDSATLHTHPVALTLGNLILIEGAHRLVSSGECGAAATVLGDVLATHVPPIDGVPKVARLRMSLAKAYQCRPDVDSNDNLSLAIRQYDQALQDSNLTDRDKADLWRERGLAYWQLRGPNRSQNLREAVKSYDEALRFQRLVYNSVAWAGLIQNKALAYLELSECEGKETAIKDLQEAREGFKASLKVFGSETYPQYWAASVFGLGLVHVRWPGPDRVGQITKAIEFYNSALRVYTEHDYPQEWAATMNNIGNAYRVLPSGNRRQTLALALSYLQQALRVRTRGTRAELWAATASNIGLVYLEQGEFDQAIRLFKQIQEVFDRSLYPVQWALTVSSLARAYAGSKNGDLHDLDRSVRALKDAIPILKANGLACDVEQAQKALEQVRHQQMRFSRAHS